MAHIVLSSMPTEICLRLLEYFSQPLANKLKAALWDYCVDWWLEGWKLSDRVIKAKRAKIITLFIFKIDIL